MTVSCGRCFTSWKWTPENQEQHDCSVPARSARDMNDEVFWARKSRR